jgi:serine/threonine-protein kinase
MSACPNDGWSFTMDVDATVHPTSAGAAAGGLAMAAAPMIDEPPMTGDLLPGSLVGEYKVDKKIGEGGMGSVYSATHPMIGKRAAIKVISTALGTDASAVARFVQEARSVNQIGHPNIVDVFAFGELSDGRNYFVMEYLQGESLAERVTRVAMPLGEAIEILDQIADALEAAHEKSIVHRDLKPDNVYLAAVRGGRTMVKLLDFGIAKLAVADGPGSGGVQKTRTGMMMGTPGYLSPEQARGKNVDHRTDVYALGCMVFEIVTGRLPFVADNAMDIVLMHMTAPAPRASEIWPEIPPQLDHCIARMLEKDVALRPSLAEVRAVFSELVTSGIVTLNNGRGVSFGSSMGRHQTGPVGGLAIGTQPATMAPRTSPPGASSQTTPPLEAPKKKSGALVGVVTGLVLVGGGIAAFIAIKGGKSETTTSQQAAAAPAATPAPAPAPAPPPAEAKPVEPVVAPVTPPGTIAITVDRDHATVTLDGKPIEITGRTAEISVDKDGDHTITVAATGHDTFEKTVTVKAGDTVTVEAKLPRTKVGKRTTAGSKKTTGAGSTKKNPAGTGDKNYTVDPFAN